ncbi:MAG: hypothetical protein R2724_20230 [Bryobacterales bacterium]
MDDPAAEFVTGGGRVDSPAGAYVPDPSMTGSANFGFVAKYKKGQQTPDGQTQFRFQAADLNFHSTSYDWLVVAGTRAQFKGLGELNGAFGSDGISGYSFLLTAVDGEQNGGGGTDAFRMKIVDKANGALVYDSGLGAGDDLDDDGPMLSLGRQHHHPQQGGRNSGHPSSFGRGSGLPFSSWGPRAPKA